MKDSTRKGAARRRALGHYLGHDLVDGGGRRRLSDHADSDGGGCQRQRGAGTAVTPSESGSSQGFGTISGENGHWRSSKTMVKATS